MKDLVALVDLLDKQKTYQIDVIDQSEKTENKSTQLYHLLRDQKNITEKEAIKAIYGDEKNKPRFTKLKGRLFQRLINSIFFIDQSSSLYSDKLNAAKICYRNYAAFKMLLGYQKRNVAVSVIEKTFKYTKKYDFTDLNYMIAAFLTNHYSTHTLNQKKYKRFLEFKRYYREALVAENDIEELQGKFNFSLSKSSSGIEKKELAQYLNKIQELKSTQKTIFTQRFNLLAYMIQANVFLELQDYSQIIDVVNEGINFFKDQGIESKDAMFIFNMRLGIANLMLQNFEEAERSFSENLQIARIHSINWYSTKNYLFSLFLLSDKLFNSYEVMSSIQNSPSFESTHPLLVQQFKIKEAYIHFLVELGKINPEESDEKPLRKFRLNRFLNDVPTYSKDKRGVNISILIIQMLLLVQNKKHGQIIDKLDALNMYSHRYLRSDNTFRSNCFIKMLTKLPDADYHPIRWQRYVEKYRKRLDEHPFELSYHNLDLEVIPFETLYDLVVEMLEKQKGMVRS